MRDYQAELEKLITDIAPVGLYDRHEAWLEENTAFLSRRLERLKKVKNYLERIKKPTDREKTLLNRFKGRVVRMENVQQHREYLLFLVRARRRALRKARTE